MENSLLCDEEWLSSPATPHCSHESERCIFHQSFASGNSSYITNMIMTKEDSERALAICLDKEFSYMPESGYVEYLQSNNDLVFARFRAVQWLIKSRTRLNLSVETIFNAANYLDRFISMSQFHGWKYWMVELLSVACLSIASKFNETSSPSLHEIQMEDLEHSFRSSTIQLMELTLLQALKWRIGSTTTYSYVELMTMTPNIVCMKSDTEKELSNLVTKMLIRALLDIKLLGYPPSFVAVSALWCSLEELVPSSYAAKLTEVTRFFSQEQKDGIVECHKIVKARLVDPVMGSLKALEKSCYCPSSPVTVLLKERVDIDDYQIGICSLFKTPAGSEVNAESSGTKRKRE